MLWNKLVAMHGPECFYWAWRGGLVLILLVDAFGRHHSPASFCMVFVTFFLSGTKAIVSSARERATLALRPHI